MIISFKKKMLKYPDRYDDDQLEEKIKIVNNDICDKKGAIRHDIDSLLDLIHSNN